MQHMHQVFERSRCLLEQETQTNPLFFPPQDSAAMMSFMVVHVSIIFMSRLDLWGSAKGVTGTTQQTIVSG
jgi:hypothetical protein